MDCTALRKKIKEAKNFAEIEPDLAKINGLSKSTQEILRTAFQIQSKQPDVANHFKETASQDIEKAVQEYVGGTSDQATNRADPTKRVDRQTTSGEQADTGFNNPVDQMGTASGSGNTKNDTPVQEDIMPGLMPDLQRQMQPQFNQMPPMNMPQQIKQMQYTANRTVQPFVNKINFLESEVKRLTEAIVKLDQKVQETRPIQSIPLQVAVAERGSGFRETTTSVPIGGYINQEDPVERSSRIAFMDKALNEGKYNVKIPAEE